MTPPTSTRPEGHVEHLDDEARAPERRPGELNLREMLRWTWRQLTSMRTALVLLLLLALAAIPGSIIPQSGVDSLKTSRWQDAHPKLTPVYEKLGLFGVYDSPWFSAIYILLMISLVGCIVPRTFVYWRALRSAPPTAPRNLTRLPDHATYRTEASVEEVLEGARTVLGKRRYRVVAGEDSVSAEKGHLREAGNLLFHLSVLVVLVGFAMGGLFGYKGGVILVVGNGFSNNLTQYDDFVPGSLFKASDMEPFSFDIKDFSVDWLTSGPRAGMARAFDSELTYRESPSAPEKSYDLKVNHPLTVGNTEVFLIGHGYAPVITVRDGKGEVVYSGPTIFLPTDQSFRSFGVVKAPDAQPTQIGLEGEFYPTVAFSKQTGSYFSAFGNTLDPLVSMLVYTGDLGMDKRHVAVGLRARQERRHDADQEERRAVPHRPAAGPDDQAAPAPRHGELRRHQALEQDPDQPDPGQAHRAGRRRPRPDRAARLAVHPAPPGLGACPPRGGRHTGRGGGPGPLRRR